MKLIETAEKMYQERLQELERSEQIANKRVEKYEEILSQVQALDVPDKTDLMERLKSVAPTTVEIEYADGRKVQEYKFVINGKIYNPDVLVSENPELSIRRIQDVWSESRNQDPLLFENPYCGQPTAVQYAKLFGKEYGLEYAEIDVDVNKLAAENMSKKRAGAEKAKSWIERGSDLAFPQKREQFQKYAIGMIEHSPEIIGAVNIMEMLDENVEPEEIKSAYERGKEIPEETMKLVAEFSKRGPEFYREVKHSNPEWLQQIERQNKYFERELSDDGKQ